MFYFDMGSYSTLKGVPIFALGDCEAHTFTLTSWLNRKKFALSTTNRSGVQITELSRTTY